jgi:hypothetical protein
MIAVNEQNTDLETAEWTRRVSAIARLLKAEG